MNKKSLWEQWSPERKKAMQQFCEDYKAHISSCKTERECVRDMVKKAQAAGYEDLTELIREGRSLQPGDKIYAVNKGKMLVLFQIGRQPFEAGMNILGAHIDSPRLDLKPNPLYESDGFAMLKTHYYGGIKKYQWVTLPLALHGVVVRKDGTVVDICIGEDPSDPVLGISDVLPHLSKDQNSKAIAEAFTGEDLNVMFGSLAAEKDDAEAGELYKKNILNLLRSKYDISEEDFNSAELELVPAGPARDYGLDRSMILAYGHDDRICSYTSFIAMLDMAGEIPEKTLCTLLVDKEEIGSVGATGMHSAFFENCVAELMELCGSYSSLSLRRTLAACKMLSSDVSAGFDPNFPGIHEKNNAPVFNAGPVLHKYTGSRGKSGSNDATAEYVAQLRRVFADNDVQYQMAELGKVDQGGGGTIAYIPARFGMDVIDLGVPLHSMHAPWETAAKTDLYEAYRAYQAFLRDM